MNLVAFLSDARSLITLISMLTFIGIVVWAWSARRKNEFDEAAMLPFADDDMNTQMKTQSQEPRHG